jgi:E3 ubiquitin-protein ligase CCNP1IP1
MTISYFLYSHIFCLQCADVLGLARAVNGRRICPACKAKLDNPDDCAVAQLDPSEDYKGSILCGLTPSDIMECATKALEFFTYQATQEMRVLCLMIPDVACTNSM